MSDFLIRALAESKTPASFVKKHLIPMIDSRSISTKAKSFPYSKGAYHKVVFVNSKGEEISLSSSRRKQLGKFTFSETWKAPKIKLDRLSTPIVSKNSERPFKDWEESEKKTGASSRLGDTFFIRIPETAIQHWNPAVEESKGGHLTAKVALDDGLFKELRERHESSDLLHRYLTSLYHVSRLFDKTGELRQLLRSEGIHGLGSERPHFIKTLQQFNFASLNWLGGRNPRRRDMEKLLTQKFDIHPAVARNYSRIFEKLFARHKAVLSMKILANRPEKWARAFDIPGTTSRILSNDWYELKERQEVKIEGEPKVESQESKVKKGARRVFVKSGDASLLQLGMQRQPHSTEERFELILKANIFLKPSVLESFGKEFKQSTPYRGSVSNENKIERLRIEIERLSVKARKYSGPKRDELLELKSRKETEFKALASSSPSIFAQNFTNFLSKKFAEMFPGYVVTLRKTRPEVKSSTDYSMTVSLNDVDKLQALAAIRSLARTKMLYSSKSSAARMSQEEWGGIIGKPGKVKQLLPPSGYEDLRKILDDKTKTSTWVRIYPVPRH